VCVLDATRQIVASSKQAIDVHSTHGRVGDQWIDLIRQTVRTSGIGRERIVGLGVGLPGAVHPGSARTRAYLPPGRWLDLDFGRKLAEFGVPVTAANNALCVAEYERRVGLASRAESFIAILVRYGVGAAFGSEAGFHADDHVHAGELGHMRIDLKGPRCICGKDGCVDVFCSGRTLPGPLLRQGRRWEGQLRRRSRYLGLAIGNLLKQVSARLVILNGIYNDYRAVVEPELSSSIAAELDGLGLPVPKVAFGEPVEFKASVGAALRAADYFLEPYLLRRLAGTDRHSRPARKEH
jgi:predicted NBD/HSP70 family sugar kinase